MLASKLKSQIKGKWWIRFLIKMLVLSILILLGQMRSSYAVDYCDTGCNENAYVGYTWCMNYCSEEYIEQGHIEGIYTNGTDAQNARNASHTGCSYRSTSYVASMFGGYYSAYGVRCVTSGTNASDNYYFIYPTSGNEGCVGECQPDDTDEDGLSDDCDPLPNDSYCFTYQTVLSKKDEQGAPYYIVNKVKNAQGAYIYYTLGEDNVEDTMGWVEINPPTKTCADWAESFCQGTYTGTLGGSGGEVQIDTSTTSVSLGSGSNSESGTDSGRLEDIVNNTKTTADNQQTIAELLAQIKDGQEKQTRVIASGSGVSVSGSGATASEIAGAISDSRSDEGELGEDQADIEESGWQNPEFDGNVESSVPEKNLISTIYNNFKQNNPISMFLSNSSVSASGSCSTSFNYQGHSIPLDLCPYEDELDLFGTLILSITSLMSLIMVVRG